MVQAEVLTTIEKRYDSESKKIRWFREQIFVYVNPILNKKELRVVGESKNFHRYTWKRE